MAVIRAEPLEVTGMVRTHRVVEAQLLQEAQSVLHVEMQVHSELVDPYAVFLVAVEGEAGMVEEVDLTLAVEVGPVITRVHWTPIP